MSLDRRTPLRRTTRLKSSLEKWRAWQRRSRKPLRSRRKGRPRYDRDPAWLAYYGSVAFVRYIHQQRCCVPGCATRAEPSHLRHRTDMPRGTWRDITPKCRSHHQQFHSLGVTRFCERFGVTPEKLRSVADQCAQQAVARGYVEATT